MGVHWGEFVLDNFLEVLARVTSHALTDEETERLVRHFQSFHARIRRASQQRLELILTTPLDQDHFKPMRSPPGLRPRTPALSRHQLATDVNADQNVKPPGSRRTPPYCLHTGKLCSQHAVRGFVKTLSVTFLLKTTFHLATAALSGKLWRNPSVVLRRAAGKDTVSFALFLSTLIGGYRGTLCLLRYGLHRRGYSDDTIRSWDSRLAFVSGTLAGLLSMKLDRNRARRVALAMYVLTRSTQFSLVWLMKVWRLHRNQRWAALETPKAGDVEEEGLTMSASRPLPSGRPRLSSHGLLQFEEGLDYWLTRLATPLFFGIGVSVIGYTILLTPETISPSYLRFITSYTGLQQLYGKSGALVLPTIAQAVNQLGDPRSPSTFTNIIPPDTSSHTFVAEHISPQFAQALIPPSLRHTHVICALEHPHTVSCLFAHLRRFLVGMPRALKLYATFNLAMAVLFSHRRILGNPRMWLGRYLVSVVRSAVFLQIVVNVLIGAPCFLRRYCFQSESKWIYALNGLLNAPALLLEHPSRRVELTMYTMLRALESSWKLGILWGWWRARRNGEVAYFALSVGVLMALYQESPDVIRDSYRSIMTRLFGRT